MTLTTPDVDDLAREMGALFVAPELKEAYRPRYNIAPTVTHPVLTAARELVPARWGLGERCQINTRTDTFAKRKAPFLACVVPADGFYEWTGEKKDRRPIWFHVEDGKLMLFAGMIEETSHGRAFSVFTVDANEQMRKIHDRMPAILAPDEAARWLKEQDRSLLRPSNRPLLETAVGARVNSVANDDPACLEPDRAPRQLRLI